MKKYSSTDKLLIKSNDILNILFNIKSSGRNYPAKDIHENEMSESDKKIVRNLMRVNHAGEVSAQGLYIGHAILSKTKKQKELMLNMASGEKDHLEWCGHRIKELKGQTSVFNPLWFTGSVAIGMLSSFTNDKNALGFIEETEKQVAAHLESHINKIPKQDNKTFAILKKMRSDEIHHGITAQKHGAKNIPSIIKKIMNITADVMKVASFRL